MKHRFALLLSGALSLICAQSAEIYVNGNAGNTTEDGGRQTPYKTIGKAMEKAVNGDTVIVSAGTYREAVLIKGKKGPQTLTLKAADGARPIISGFKLATEWTKGEDNLYTTTVSFLPRCLLMNDQFMQLSRIPEVGWLRKKQLDKVTFTADVTSKVPAGTTCYVWYANGNVFGQLKIKDNPKSGTFVLEPSKARFHETADLIYFKNNPKFIRKHGQWAWKRLARNKFEVTVKCDVPIDSVSLKIGGAGVPILVEQCQNIAVSGFDVVGSANTGATARNSQHVIFSKIGSFWNNGGMGARFCKDITFEDCRVAANQSGISTANNEQVAIRKCDVGYNCEDGVRVIWKSKNAIIEGCRIHHQLWRGHPDNIQFYRDVEDVVVKDCIVFSGFQGLMAEEIKNFTLENNLFLGSCASLVIWGHHNCFNITMKNNTTLFGRWFDITCTGSGFNFSNNIIGTLYFLGKGPHSNQKYQGNNNLFMTERANGWWPPFSKNGPRKFTDYVRMAPDPDSTQQVLPVKGMPPKMGTICHVPEATCDTFDMAKQHIRNFKVGDIVEISFDGVPRTVTKVTDKNITVTPPRKYPPSHGYIILNWKDQKDMVWKPQFDKNVGSNLSWDDIRRDRVTSVPLPANVKNYIDNIDALIIW